MMSVTADGDFAEGDEPDVGQPPARADRRKAAGEIGLEAGALDQPRADRVERARQDQRALALHEGMEAHCSLIFPSLRIAVQRATSSASSALHAGRARRSRRLGAGRRELGDHVGLGQDGAQLRVEPRDHRVRRPGRRRETEPGDAFEPRHAGFRDRRDVGGERRALLGRDGEALELAARICGSDQMMLSNM